MTQNPWILPPQVLDVDPDRYRQARRAVRLAMAGMGVCRVADAACGLNHVRRYGAVAVVVQDTGCRSETLRFSRRVRSELGDYRLPVVVVGAPGGQSGGYRLIRAGADSILPAHPERDSLVPLLRRWTAEYVRRVRAEKRQAQAQDELVQLHSRVLGQQASGLLSRAAAMVGHDQANLLQVQSIALHCLTRNAREGQPPDPESLADLLRTHRHMVAMSQDLVALGRAEEEPMGFTLDLSEVAQRAVRLLGTRGRQGAVRVELTPPVGVVPVRGSSRRLELATYNLLKNAVRAAGEGASGKVTVGVEMRGGNACIVVQDNGPGVPAALRERVFEAWLTTAAAQGGTGLGLPMVQRVAAAHGGQVLLESPAEGGARFVLALPGL